MKDAAELAELEWLCRDVLEWDHMKCMQKIMRNDPNFYALLVSIIYKTDDNGASDEAKRTSANNVYSGFNKQNFAQQKRMEGKLAILFAIKGTVEFTFEIFTNINSYNLELKVSEFKYTFKFIDF